MSDWSYPALELDEVEEPTWECPEGLCRCGGEQIGERFEFSVLLCDPKGERMPAAPCRVVAGGVVLPDQQPCADGAGWMTVAVPHKLHSVVLMWAPPGMPQRPDLPYAKRYYVQLRLDDRHEAARRRLHNLGFGQWSSLSENIKAFQCHYDQPVSGELDDIDGDLSHYHDQGCVPLAPARPETPTAVFPLTMDEPPAGLPQLRDHSLLNLVQQVSHDPSPANLGGGGPAQPQSSPPPPASRGGKKLGGGTPVGQGTALPSAVLPKRKTPQRGLPFKIRVVNFDIVLPRLKADIDGNNLPNVRLDPVVARGRVRAAGGYGYIFMRQFVEYALILARVGTDVTMIYVYPGVDAQSIMPNKGRQKDWVTQLKVPGNTSHKGTDKPSYKLDRMVGASPQVRVTIHMAAAFQTYFMYADFNPRKPPGSMTHPMSRWIALAGKRWQFYAVATGLSGPGNKWFTLCQRKSTAAVDRKPLDPAQIPPANTPVTTVSRSVSGSFVLPVSPTAKTGLEAGC